MNQPRRNRSIRLGICRQSYIIMSFSRTHWEEISIHIETGSCTADLGPRWSERFVSSVPERLGDGVDDFNVPDKVVQSTAPNPCAAEKPYWHYVCVVHARTPLSDAKVNS